MRPRQGAVRVLVVHNRYRSELPSGENHAVDQEVDLLQRAGHEVFRYERESDEIQRFPIVEKAALPLRLMWSRADHARVAELLAQLRPQVVHVHNTFPLISPSVLGACAAAGTPVVATLHNFRLFCANGLLFRDGRPCETCLDRSSLPAVRHACYRDSRLASLPLSVSLQVHRSLGTWHRGVTAFIALSQFAKRKLAHAGLSAGRIHVKPNFVRRAHDGGRAGSDGHFLFLGRLSEEKGVDLLLDAWSASFGRLLLAGDGPKRDWIEGQLARHAGSVELLGPRSRQACMDLLAGARALVVPSRWYEGFPLVVAEAYAQGVPIVAPSHGTFPEIVEDGGSGLLFPPGDAEGLADRLRELRADGTSRRMGRRARQLYEERYTPERNLELLLAIYERAMTEARSA
jgi:glycosyltransferase involved in cell wall biosynthesis